jgi:hypothetical protein
MVATAVVLGGLSAMVPRAGAYPQYSVSDQAGYCADCHGDFRAKPYTSLKGEAGGTWTKGLHDAHRQDMLGGDCDACHGSQNLPVLLDSSSGVPPFDTSCLGCHGRVEGADGLTGRGLRAHHERHGVDCFSCHGETADSPVVPETEPPPLYIVDASHPDLPTDPCNPSPDFPESFAGTTLGLDNDGNDLYDQADPACAAAAPAIALDPDTLGFGSVTVGTTSAPRTSEIRNTGTATLTVTAIALCAAPATSAEFAFGSPALPLEIAPGASATVSVTYAPEDVGTDTGCIAVTSDDPASPIVSLDLSGTGVTAPVPVIGLDPPALDFGTVAVGGSADLAVQVQNTGTADLSVTAIALCAGTSAEFGWTAPALPFDVPPDGSAEIAVTYAPAGTGTDSGCLALSHDAPGQADPLELPVAGVGEAEPEPEPGACGCGEGEAASGIVALLLFAATLRRVGRGPPGPGRRWRAVPRR